MMQHYCVDIDNNITNVIQMINHASHNSLNCGGKKSCGFNWL